MICEECKSCPIKVLCDEVDTIIDETLSFDDMHDILMAIYGKGRADAEAEQKAMCESCIHKVSADDLRAIKYDAVDELSNRCITHIQQSKPLTIEEIIHIIQFEADQMKGK